MNKFSRRDEKDVMIFMLVVIFPLGSVVNLNILMSQNPLITFSVDGHRQFVGNHEILFLFQLQSDTLGNINLHLGLYGLYCIVTDGNWVDSLDGFLWSEDVAGINWLYLGDFIKYSIVLIKYI